MRQHVDIPEEEATMLETWLAQLNADEPPDHQVPWFTGHLRHICTKGASRSIECKERYETLTSLLIGQGSLPPIAIIFREGKCSRCGQSARSPEGMVVFARSRPPLMGRVSR